MRLSVHLLLVMLAALALGPLHAAESDPLSAFPRGTLEIVTTGGRIHRLNVWVAADDRRRMQGLMHVKDMPDDSGMLFIFRSPGPISMWMKNTIMSLDMVFIGPDGRVGRVAERTEPFSLDTISSGFDALGVLELKAGAAGRLGIAPGTVIMHPAFRR